MTKGLWPNNLSGEKDMERIVILGRRGKKNDDLIRLLEILFPECEISLVSTHREPPESVSPMPSSLESYKKTRNIHTSMR